MANNRLYLVDTESNEYVMIAKNFGGRWQLGNVDLLDDFLLSTYEDEKTGLILVSENDRELYDKHIAKGTNANKAGSWKYYQKTNHNEQNT